MTKAKKFIGFLMCSLLCAGVLVVGGVMTYLKANPGQESWYAELSKPVWAPTLEQFAPIWGGLFFFLAISGWLIWLQQDDEPVARLGLKFFVAMLSITLVWVFVFFFAKNPGAGVIEVLILWLATLATLGLFNQRQN